MASFPTLIGIGGNLDVSFCEDMWMHNYLYSMFLPKPDNSKMEEEHFKEMKVEEFSNELKNLYSEFKKINLIAVYPRFIAEINMGFVARICNLTFDIVDFVKCHKGEIADLTFRTTLESFIVGSWLLKKKDIILHQRFRDFSLGKDRLMGEKIVQKATTEKMKKKAKKFIYDAIKDAGRLEIDVASERGDIFDLRIDQMANEVWGEDNEYYYLYKRASETTHGHWRVMAKFHLAKSLNPMHNGLYQYNDNPNRFAGLIPAFKALNIAAAFLLTILDQIESEELSELKKKVKHFKRQAMEEYVKYFNTYIDK
jgi:hypothetical protein